MTLSEFIAKYDGKHVEVGGSPGAVNQCVDLVNAYLEEVLGITKVLGTNARDFPSKLPQLEWVVNTPTGVPSPGDIAIWQHNQYGHIGVVTEANVNTFKSFDQNYPTNSPAHVQEHNYTNPKLAGWLRVPNVTTTIAGIDISRHQGSVDFNAVKSQVSFVIIKATEGTGFTDPKFNEYLTEIRKVGLLAGAYHFARPDLNNTAIEEADWFLSVYKPLPGEFLALDYEANWNGDVVAWCKAFLDRVSSQLEGYKPPIYLNRSLANGKNWSPVISAGYGLWIASYDNNPTSVPVTPWTSPLIKQYTSSGSVSGISGSVDMDTFFGSSSMYKKYGYKGEGMLTQNELDACMADRQKFWQERDAALAKVATLEKQVADLQKKLTECENKETVVSIDLSKWELNGMTVQTGNIVRNYKLK